MELKTFIQQSLVDICEAVRGANKALEPTTKGNKMFLLDSARDQNYAPIEFDIAVTISRTDDVKAGAAVKIMVFESTLGSDGKSERQTVSRIAFKIVVNEDIG